MGRAPRHRRQAASGGKHDTRAGGSIASPAALAAADARSYVIFRHLLSTAWGSHKLQKP